MTESIIGHIDMDSFYASIEIRDNPDLIGKPVIIGADPKLGRGVVSTCSYESRKSGVKSGMPISTAYRLCPDGIYIKPDIKKYSVVSDSIMNEIRKIVPGIEQVSIDEAYLDLTDSGSYNNARELAITIKNAIKETEHLTSSVGIAPSRNYAKIASEYKKPDGLFVLKPQDLRDFLFAQPAKSIPGIGKRAATVLAGHNINTIHDLAITDIQVLRELIGSYALKIHEIAIGADRTGLHESELRKSISRETTYLKDTSDEEELMATLDNLAACVHYELISDGFRYRTLTIKIRYTGFVTVNQSYSMAHPKDSLDSILRSEKVLFRQNWTGEPVRLIGIRLSGLVNSDPGQTTLTNFLV